MRRTRRLAIAIAIPALTAGAVGSAQADVQLESTPCVVTLAPSYSADAYGTLAQEIPYSAVACPGFSVQGLSFNVWFTAPTGRAANFAPKTSNIYDPATNSIVSRNFLELIPQGAATYTGVRAPSVGENYITNTATSKNYRVVLANPFTVVDTSPASPACTLALDPSYGYVWDQEPYFVVPDSVISCEGFTYSSELYDTEMTFSSKVLGAGRLHTASRTIFNAAAGTFKTTRELRLTSYKRSGQLLAGREAGLATPAGSDGWTWGRFSQDPNGAQVRSVTPDALGRIATYRLTLSQSFAIKRASAVTATARRVAGGLRVKVHADRNWSFQNRATPTHRRQTVVPTSGEDHALIKRDGKVVKRVTLNVYGNATVTIPRPAGRRRAYTVVMVQTDQNLAGSAVFRG